jgi:PmbA protein
LLGKQVLPKGLSLVEDPHRPRMSAHRAPLMARGWRPGAGTFVADGVLTGWVLDLATGPQAGDGVHRQRDRAGHLRHRRRRPRNIDLTQGSVTRDDLLKQMGTGLLVTSMIGSTISATTGDYSRGASGFWVENGQLAYPVHECTIAGNLRDMLLRIIPANDARAHLSTACRRC